MGDFVITTVPQSCRIILLIKFLGQNCLPISFYVIQKHVFFPKSDRLADCSKRI